MLLQKTSDFPAVILAGVDTEAITSTVHYIIIFE